MKVYIATRFDRAEVIESGVATVLRRMRFETTSTWHRPPFAPKEALETVPLRIVQAIAETNDADLRSADVVLVLAVDGARETWAELRYALTLGKTCVVVGPPFPLSAYRHGVDRVESLNDAVALLTMLRDAAAAVESLA